MSSNKDAIRWCNDNLHDLLGFANDTLASYLVSLASQSHQSEADLVRVLRDGGVDQSPDRLSAFCRELIHRTKKSRRKEDGNNSHDATTTTSHRSKSQSAPPPISVTSSNQDEVSEMPLQQADTTLENTRASRKRRYRRSDDSGSDEDDDEENGLERYHRQMEARMEARLSKTDEPEEVQSNLTPEERAALERERDLRERDELVERMLSKDKDKTKDLVKVKEEEEAYQKRIKLEERLLRGEKVVDEDTGREITVDSLREESRRAYLKKREERELQLLKQSLEDEEELFKGQQLTRAEKEQLELKRKILAMAQEKEAIDDKHDGFYRLPDQFDETERKGKQDHDKLTMRYVEPKQEKSEQELWESAQTEKAIRQIKKKGKEDEYELVFDDQIDFILQESTKGYDKRDKKHRARAEEPARVAVDTKELRPVTEHEKILAGRKMLPVYPFREEFLAAVKQHSVLIVVGETGSGKTTQLPQYLDEIGYSELGKIGCTQPRRIAAMSVAARVAQEMNVRLGHEVGYSIRFENCTSPKTRIQYMTDGMLLREILTEPDLASYSCMVIDEAHERTLHTDILFGLLKDIARFRSDLKLIVSSATLDAEKFSRYFDNAPIFMIPGRMFPVDIYYTKAPEADYVDASVVTVLQIHVTQPLNGDILVFLTGQDEIETAAEILTQRSRALGSRIPELIICPIYANLPSDQQAKIFEKTPKGARKVVIATNIAETSLTIDGICYVIDCGFSKQKTFNARSGMESLVVTPISQAASNQRVGRAGRTQPGKAFRLFTAWSFQNELEPNTTPEILRSNMGNVVLLLKTLGINDLMSFDFMDAPPADALMRALEQLYALGALNDRGELTKLGRRMAEFPVDPTMSKAIIASEKYKCVSEVLSTVAMLSLGASVFFRPKEKAVHADTARLNFARGGGGDFLALFRCYRDWAATEFSPTWCFENYAQLKSMKKARDIRDQLEGLCERVELDPALSAPDDIDTMLKAITSGFFYNIAKLGRSGEYQTIKHRKTVYIHPSSVLAKDEQPPAWVVFFELAFTTKEYMRQVSPIQPSWLVDIAPHYYNENDVEDTKAKKMPKMRKR